MLHQGDISNIIRVFVQVPFAGPGSDRTLMFKFMGLGIIGAHIG